MSKRRPPSLTSPEPPESEETTGSNEAPPRHGSLTRELGRVEALNTEFYDAFHHRDIERMAGLWSRSPYARCVHPGWEPVVGWQDIRHSWAEIFESMERIEFQLEDVHIEVSNDAAWVNLLAHAEVKIDDEDTFATSVVTTTVLERTDGEWRIALHHSSHFVDDDELSEDDLEITGPDFGEPN